MYVKVDYENIIVPENIHTSFKSTREFYIGSLKPIYRGHIYKPYIRILNKKKIFLNISMSGTVSLGKLIAHTKPLHSEKSIRITTIILI